MIEPVTATIATSVATILFTKALEKTGENLGDMASEQIGKLWDAVRAKFQAEDVAGKITKAEADPSEKNVGRFQSELEELLEDDGEFLAELQGILAALEGDAQVKQVLLKNIDVAGDAEIGDMSQSSSGGNVSQEAITDVKVGGNLKIGNVDQQG
ncbi:fis family transcriptional regulator [[Leptolyngbya] sp. PCC 7376]|uniref:hypothetical protein n=1 Tax=[Leptolyngbya] sp. PCC 7376 TaxID=111781 RepID=UPI00029F1614|nr:hypothetical protein [[Leptolyngbya] sp. PCC 7376]AFY38362.1 fis family transcriptional regulator [[Leptolyngbya] sp. PCC 7376]